MSDNRRGGDWKEWSQHVLQEIQRLNDRQERMQDTLAENTKQLEIHIEGVKLAREQNNMIKAQLKDRILSVEDDLTPVKDHVRTVDLTIKFWGKLLGGLVALPALIYYCLSIWMKLTGRG